MRKNKDSNDSAVTKPATTDGHSGTVDTLREPSRCARETSQVVHETHVSFNAEYSNDAKHSPVRNGYFSEHLNLLFSSSRVFVPNGVTAGNTPATAAGLSENSETHHKCYVASPGCYITSPGNYGECSGTYGVLPVISGECYGISGGSPKTSGGSPKTSGGSPRTSRGSPKTSGGSPGTYRRHLVTLSIHSKHLSIYNKFTILYYGKYSTDHIPLLAIPRLNSVNPRHIAIHPDSFQSSHKTDTIQDTKNSD